MCSFWPSISRDSCSRMDFTHEVPMSTSMMNLISSCVYHEKLLSILQTDGVEHTDRCEIHPASVPVSAPHLKTAGQGAKPWPWGQRQQLPALGWGVATYTIRFPQKSRIVKTPQSSDLPQLSTQKWLYPFWLSQCSISPLAPDPFPDLTLTDQEYFGSVIMSNAARNLFLRLSSLSQISFFSFHHLFTCKTK